MKLDEFAKKRKKKWRAKEIRNRKKPAFRLKR